MKAVFMGTPEFAVPVLKSMASAGHEICAVVTQPDKPKGRGKAMQPTPVKECAIELSIPVFQPVKVREEAFVEKLRKLAPEVIVVAAFGQILPQEVLDIPKYGCINVHASLLPRWRGAAPIQWAVISGDKESGVTIMQMDAGLDTGDMLLKEAVSLEEKETGGSLHDKLSEIGAKLLVQALEGLEKGTLVPEKQDGTKSCYAKMLTKQLGEIDFTRSAEEIERLIRGLNPWPSAYTHWNGKTLKIWEAKALPETGTTGETGEAGMITEVTKDCFFIQTGKGILAAGQVQLEGKKRMDASDFLRGCPLKKGEILR